MNSYYSNTGTYQADLDRLVALMPSSGNCATVAVELVRAVCKLSHDFYNNGMGNNTSGAVNYLFNKGAIDAPACATIYYYAIGRQYSGNYTDDSMTLAIESMVDNTLRYILANPNLETDVNTEDMFDYEEEAVRQCESCEEEVQDGGFLCNDCEGNQWESWEDEED